MKHFFSFMLLLITLNGCNNKPETNKNKIGKIENFDEFIDKFSKDNIFRISRVKFPLKGFNSDETDFNAKDKIYIWEKEDWLFYATEDFKNIMNDSSIKSKVVKTEANMIYNIYKNDSGYDIKYEFKQIENKWYLEFYSYKNF